MMPPKITSSHIVSPLALFFRHGVSFEDSSAVAISSTKTSGVSPGSATGVLHLESKPETIWHGRGLMTTSTGRENVMKRGRTLLRSYVLGKCRVGIKVRLAAGILSACLLGMTAASRGDDFSRLEGAPFFELINGTDAHIHPSLTFR